MNDDPDDEALMARLLQIGGTRPAVPADVTARVRRAVVDECRTVARQRAHRRRLVWSAAGLAAAAAALWAVWTPAPSDPIASDAVVASVERVEGNPGVRIGQTILAGERVESGGGRVSLRLAGGVSVRVDRSSTIRVVAPASLTLDAGTLYVDSGEDSPGVEVRTARGVVRDVGTQFEVSLSSLALRVRVRSGLVQVEESGRLTPAGPGTEIQTNETGWVARSVAPFGPDWAWIASLAPPMTIEGRTLSSFLQELCREHGWTLRYDEGTLAREASGIILHGTVTGLSPSDALAVVMRTTALTHRLEDGMLLIGRSAPR